MPRRDKYLLVKSGIRRRIADGEWKPGEKLPAYDRLAELFRVGIGTVRRAVETLEGEGVIICRHGSGTYVSSYIKGGYWNRFQRFQRPDGSIIERFRDRILLFEVIPASADIAEKLCIPEGTEVVHWKRRMRFDEKASGLDESYLVRSIFPRISAEDFENREPGQNLYALLEKTDGVLIASSSDYVRAEMLSEEDAQLITLPAGIPMLVVTRITYDAHGTPCEYRIEKADSRYCRIRL